MGDVGARKSRLLPKFAESVLPKFAEGRPFVAVNHAGLMVSVETVFVQAVAAFARTPRDA